MSTRRLPVRKSGSPRSRSWLPALLLASILCLAWYSGGQLPSLPRAVTGDSGATLVTADAVNLRGGPSTAHTVVTVLAPGTDVFVTGPETDGFVPVDVGAESGWLAREYLAEPSTTLAWTGPAEANAAENPPPPEPTAANHTVAENVEAPESLAEPTVPPAPVSAERWIRIDRSEAAVSLMAGDTVLNVFAGRIGRDPSTDGFYATAIGSYQVYSKNKGLAPTPFAEDTWLTDWVGFDPVRKNGIHSPVREKDGTVREWQNETTLGCVRLSEADAVTVFEFAEIGMRVEVVE